MNVLVVDDHPLLRNGIREILLSMPEIDSCDVACNGKSAIQAIHEKHYDLILMDLHMPLTNGFETIDIINSTLPDNKIRFILMIDHLGTADTMIREGMRGYILKSSTKIEIIESLNNIFKNQIYLSKKASVLTDVLLTLERPWEIRQKIELTELEKKIILLICQQYNTEEISDILCMAESTVKNYRSDILKKTGAKNVVGIAMYAIKSELFIPRFDLKS